MYFAEVWFPFGTTRKKTVVGEEVTGLIVWWNRNGQVNGRNWSVIVDEKGIRAFLILPERTALAKKHANKYVTASLEKLVALGVEPFLVTILGREMGTFTSCRCRKPSRYYLFASVGSPLWCGDCRNPVPLYRIPPISGDEYYGILMWNEDHLACDTLWLGSAVGERFSGRQMSEPESELSRAGREICAAIEEKTGIPTYFYLHRYSGRSMKSEKARKCPVCSGEWLLAERWGIFDFQCDGCRLLSSLAVNFPR
jgi:predicted  nucleic acid-binding Zn ribbon protein